MSFYYQKRFEICLKKFAIVDDTLEELGTPKLYQKMYARSKQVIIGWIAYSLSINFYDTLWWFSVKRDIWGFLVAHIINHCVNINAFVDLFFIFILWYVGNRFDKINEHMQCLLVKEEHEFKSTWKKPAELHRYTLHIYNYKTTLWVLMHLHLELRRIARELNSMFGIQITLEMTSYFVSISTMCYGIFVMLMQEHQEQISVYVWTNIIFWVSSLIMRLYLINHIYESVKVKAKKIDKTFHQLTNILQYADIWKEIYQFSLQAMYHPLEFTAMNLFYLGNDFLRKFCTTVVTYVIIMVQMAVSMLD
ncbi:uncharacterized protein LOC126857776 [Cataglyphis hispanica]|uniref:uncharacterized protein LOC126857776 n=1 Tax=Cataglyphis hispanica TaxID=1086592 RepID=UPI002180233D|nr:uncharacterized protein LOC126857776 [Cataglyphis hispanica]